MNKEIKAIRDRVREAQLNYYDNMDTIEGILVNERGYITREPLNEDVVAICSGGLDSSVMLNLMIEEWNVRVHQLFIRRGATAEKLEEEAFDYFTEFYRNKFPDNIGEVAKLDYEIPPKPFKEHFSRAMVNTTGHPLRNSTMQNLAVMYAVSLNGKLDLNIRTVLTGSVGEDNTEPELGLSSLRAQTLNTCINLGDWDWQITSPMTDTSLRPRPLYKVNLIKYAVKNNIPLDRTRTCFSRDTIADGTCHACQKRLQAFEYAGVEDPIDYRRREQNGD
jgi:7-cyano-7-deazaguanine synthase